MRLNITISEKFEDGLSSPHHISTNIMADLEDCDVHAYFKVFERVLGMMGFSETVIMTGAAELAFNEYRSKEAMAKVADHFELILAEDLNEDLAEGKLDGISNK
jgi:hypothetical protein